MFPLRGFFREALLPGCRLRFVACGIEVVGDQRDVRELWEAVVEQPLGQKRSAATRARAADDDCDLERGVK